jgi:hypothetical protein
MFQTCRRKWAIHYGLQLRLPENTLVFHRGTIGHDNIQARIENRPAKSLKDLHIDTGMMTLDEMNKLQEYSNLLPRIMDVYFDFYSVEPDPETECEVIIEREYGPFCLKGTVDRKSPDTMFDSKFVGKFSDIQEDAYKLRFQFWFYMFITGRREIIVDLIKYPELKQKQGETQAGFINRCVADVKEEPEKYFKRFPINITDEQMLEWENAVLNPLLTDYSLTATGRHKAYPNTNACYNFFKLCPHYALCHSGDVRVLDGYTQTETKHQAHYYE